MIDGRKGKQTSIVKTQQSWVPPIIGVTFQMYVFSTVPWLLEEQ